MLSLCFPKSVVSIIHCFILYHMLPHFKKIRQKNMNFKIPITVYPLFTSGLNYIFKSWIRHSLPLIDLEIFRVAVFFFTFNYN